MTFITAQELRKTYQTKTGPVRALDGLNLSVEQGTVREGRGLADGSVGGVAGRAGGRSPSAAARPLRRLA